MPSIAEKNRRKYLVGVWLDRDEYFLLLTAVDLLNKADRAHNVNRASFARAAMLVEAERVCRKFKKEYPELEIVNDERLLPCGRH